MAGGKVKKGFFFYLLIFFILIAAFVGVCVVIMLFNPGKNVLGFQYFNNGATHEIVTTTDESETALKLGETSYESIEIDAGPAQVVIENNQNYDKHSIVIVNNSKGFVLSDQSQLFEYSVTIEGDILTGKKLKIDLISSEGFLNFSKDIQVRVHFADVSIEGQQKVFESFENTAVKIKTTSGNVLIGGNKNPGYSADISPKSIDVETDSGNITISSHAKNTYDNISLSTKSGTINLLEQTNLIAEKGDVKLNIGNGKLKAKAINDNVQILADDATIEVEDISGNVDISCRTSIIDINNITGNLNFAEGSEVMNASKVYIDKVGGFVNVLQARDSDIYITEIGGSVNIHTTSGYVRLGSEEKLLKGTIFVETLNGQIDTFFGESNNARFLVSENGKINAYFGDAVVGNRNKFSSNEGDLSVSFKGSSKVKFVFDITNPTNENKFDLKNVKFDILDGKALQDNPYYHNCNEESKDGTIKIITNKSITLELIAEQVG